MGEQITGFFISLPESEIQAMYQALSDMDYTGDNTGLAEFLRDELLSDEDDETESETDDKIERYAAMARDLKKYLEENPDAISNCKKTAVGIVSGLFKQK